MKIAYVTYRPTAGIYQKLLIQAKAAKNVGLNIDFIVISEEDYKRNDNIILNKISWPKNKIHKRIAKRFFQFQMIQKSTNLTAYDRIIMRYPGAMDFWYKSFFEKYRNKVILEYHSIVLDELKNLERGILNPLRICLESKLSPKITAEAIGIIGVTQEIRKKQLEISKNPVPSCVISNGVDVKSVEFSKFQPFNGKTLNMIFVANLFYSYHGLDRLLKGILEYKGDIILNLFIVGEVFRKEEKDLIKNIKTKNINVVLAGKLKKQLLNQYYYKSNIAISSLAAYRKNLKEGCALKTREYLSRGIPFIYGYNDVDLPKIYEFAFHIHEEESPIKIEQLIEFALRVSEIENLSEKMRDFAHIHLDWKVKLNEMYQFASLEAKYE